MATLLVAPVLSFVLAVIVCVLWNDNQRATATLGERRRTRDYKTRLLAELESLRHQYAREKEAMQNSDAMVFPIADFSSVKDDARSLGLLTAREASTVLEAYTTYVEQMSSLVRHGSPAELGEGGMQAYRYDLQREGSDRGLAESAAERIIAAATKAIATLRAVPLAAADDRYPHLTSWLSPRRSPM